jgi:hypothetical protein
MKDIKLFGVTLGPDQIRYGLIGVFALLFLYMMYSNPYPEFQAWQDKSSQIAQQQQQIDAAASLRTTKEQLEQRFRTVNEHMAAARSRFPNRDEILSILLVDLSQIFSEAGVEMVSFEPKGFTTLEQPALRDVGKMEINVSAKGDYPSMILLFDRLAHYDRVLRVQTPKILGSVPDEASPTQGGGMPTGSGAEGATFGFNKKLSSTFILSTYALK